MSRLLPSSVMEILTTVPGLSPRRVRLVLSGLPEAEGYDLAIKPLRYRTRPHLAALTEFGVQRITVQVPHPFLPFGEIVPYAAKRLPAKGLRFVWLSEGVTFRSPSEVVRFLYLHEWMQWYVRERLGQRAHKETACDRFALWNYQRKRVGEAQAQAALRRIPRTDK